MMTAEQLSALTEWVLLVGRRVYPDKFPTTQPVLCNNPTVADEHGAQRQSRTTEGLPVRPSGSPSVQGGL